MVDAQRLHPFELSLTENFVLQGAYALAHYPKVEGRTEEKMCMTHLNKQWHFRIPAVQNQCNYLREAIYIIMFFLHALFLIVYLHVHD